MENFNKINFFGKYFRLAFLFIVLMEIFSYGAYLYPFFNPVVFFTILFFALILSLNKLECGVYILLAELFIGSKGYLFSLPYNGLDLSLRMGLFLIVMSVWLAKIVFKLRQSDNLKKAVPFLNSKFRFFYFLLFVFLVLSLISGVIRGNSFVNIFFDFNGWLYLFLILPFFGAIKGKEQIVNIFQILFASLLVLGLKTIFLFYIFSHQITIAMPSFYYWTRKSGLGEVTMLNLNFYRVFFQSQIYSLIGFFVIFPVFIKRILEKRREAFRLFDFLLLCGISLLISFSRSFWAGLLFGAMVLLIIFKFYFKERWKIFFKTIYYLAAIFLISLFLIVFLINFPEKGVIADDFGSLIQRRIIDATQESAGRSRIDLLPPLFKAIIKHPVLGSGFGAAVTYKSSDPRILETNKDGWHTTYAFEWGYLDLWLKIGLLGLLIYFCLIWLIFKTGWDKIKNLKFEIQNNIKIQDSSIQNTGQDLIFGMLMGLLALLATNFFSPYLNHPLGIGYLMLCSVIFERLSNQQFNNRTI
ncbi:MAG: Uncharacterized protein Athens101410_558 [Parcubacteria group bacterium Athens1014_10]|nr:MAG: Uncharacterized protein Athens101410_558 [Parcubacteria group bacterium Athens1014_10]TSD04726.1 MAG: Uncharacterized protein Athens071412_670 [Parcubacteria group bacterium Athens0714_12]